MSLKSLTSFTYFDLEAFLREKRLLFVKADPWEETTADGSKRVEGAKVVLQIAEDRTTYSKPDVSNFGEQLKVKVRGINPSAYNTKLKHLQTFVSIDDVEKAVVYGEYKNELSIIAVVNAVVKN